MKAYVPRPIKVSWQFRNLVRDEYPQLEKVPYFWPLMQLALFGPRAKEDRGRVLITNDMVREVTGCWNKAISTDSLLRAFEVIVGIDLQLSKWDSREKKARTMDPIFSTPILQALKGPGVTHSPDGSLVWFDTGIVVTSKANKAYFEEYDRSLLEVAENTPLGHPSRQLLEYLHTATERQMRDQLCKTMHLLWDEVMSMPGTTYLDGSRDHNQKTKDYTIDLLRKIEQYPLIRYKSVANTLRLFSQGCSVAKLPRRLRKLAMCGCHEFDLSQAQLGVIAKIWDIPMLQRFIESGGNIWDELYTWCGVTKEAKPKLKQALYSIVFGGERGNPYYDGILKRFLNKDDGDWNESITEELFDRFMTNPLIKEIHKYRETVIRDIAKNGGGFDAFGHWVDVKSILNKKTLPAKVRSIMANIVQSHELRIMLSMLPVLKVHKQLYVMVWLHDGVIIKFTDASKSAKQIRQILNTVNAYIRKAGYYTKLEVSYLDYPDTTQQQLAA